MNNTKNLVDLEKKIRQTRDRLGQSVDEKIIQTVVALNVNNIPTFASCEGHLDHGEPFPWVDLGNPEDKKLKQRLRTAKEYWDKANRIEIQESKNNNVYEQLKIYHQLMADANKLSLEKSSLIFKKLNSFYSKYNPPYGLRIITTTIGSFIRIQPEDGVSQALRNSEDKKNRLIEYQDEFDKFSNFLLKGV